MTRRISSPDTSAQEWEFGIDWFKDLQEKVKYNVYQSEYYERMAEDYHDEGYRLKAERTLACSKVWDLYYYIRHGIKQIKSIARCHDAFCYVCQSLKAQRRFEICSPILRRFEQDNDVYHIVFTVPNVTGPRLKWTLNKMYSRFPRLIEYFTGSRKIKDIDFEQYGYIGAVRSLEITTGKQGKDYHPHFHCMFILRKSAPNMEKVCENSFSKGKTDHYDGSRTKTIFSKFEWLLQRVWCLLMLDLRVTASNIRNIYSATEWRYKDGFDVKSDNAEGAYHEIFKYAIKGTYKEKSIFSYEQFQYLENALKNRRVYETYGCLKDYNFEDVEDIFATKTMSDYYFEGLLIELQRRETPQAIQSCVEDILKDLRLNRKRKQKIHYIGPVTLRRAFGKMTDEEKEECFEKMRKAILGTVPTEVVGEGFFRPEEVRNVWT